MARGSYLWDKELERWLPRGEVLARRTASAAQNRSPLACPMVIGTMPEIRSMVDGRIYSDKSSYYRSVERAGCAIVGFDKNWEGQVNASTYDDKKHEADVVADVKKSIEQVSSNGGVPGGE